jgi:hypothetical protein
MVAMLILGLLMAGQAAPLPDRDCLDDNLVDRCAESSRADTREKLGMVAISDEAGTGAEIYRAYFVDGYGQDMPSVSFERRPGQGPVVVVYGQGGEKISAPVSAGIWRKVQAESVLADRQILDPATSVDSSGRTVARQLPICLHSWVQTVEMANTWPETWRAVPVRVRTEDSCGGALTTRFAHQLAELAVEAVPHCDVLDETQQRNRVTQLATCLALKGDRMAAAELRNARLSFGLRPGADATSVYAWQGLMGTNGSPRLVWGDQVVRTERGRNQNVASFLIAKQVEVGPLTFRQVSFEGVNAREARAEGVASYRVSETSWQARYRQTWVWDPAMQEWMISDWIIEPFTAVSTSS